MRCEAGITTFGSDQDSINNFMDLGKGVISWGGVFDIVYDAR